jgi:hypothetical protein
MPDTKITALTALTAADPANDVLPIVDVSDTTMAASGTTKKISINNVLGCSGTATLASATISGAATVGTTLGVTGVATFAAGTALLPALTTTGDANTGIYYPAADTFAVTTGGSERFRIDSSSNVGIGVTPSGTIYSSSETRLVVKGTANNYVGTVAVQSNGTTNAVTGFLTAGDGVNEVAIGSTTNTPITFFTNNVRKATIDTSGNLILQSSATPATLTTNGQLTVNATSNTNLRFSYRGSDGVTRVADITLA